MSDSGLTGDSAGDNTTSIILVEILAADRAGLVHEVSDVLFGLGANLADTKFAVLGEGCRFASLVEVPSGTVLSDLEQQLAEVPQLESAEIIVRDYPYSASRQATGKITHRLAIDGGDRPGLVQRISEALVDMGVNIVRLDAHQEDHQSGRRYVTGFALYIPPEAVQQVDNAISNISGSLRLQATLTEDK